MSTGRNTTTRDKHRAFIRRAKPDCGICQGARGPINYDAHYLDPMSFVVDHIMPLHRGGLDVIENKQAAHRDCNRLKSDKLPDDVVADQARTFVTHRCWW